MNGAGLPKLLDLNVVEGHQLVEFFKGLRGGDLFHGFGRLIEGLLLLLFKRELRAFWPAMLGLRTLVSFFRVKSILLLKIFLELVPLASVVLHEVLIWRRTLPPPDQPRSSNYKNNI